MDDVAAIERLKRGDIGGLETLVRRYQVQAVRAAYLIVHDRPLAEDIAQTAFLRVYERVGQFDTGRPFGPWFLRSVVNDAIKAAQRRQRQVSLDRQTVDGEAVLAEILADPAPGPEARWDQAETAQRVRRALGRLSPRLRAPIVLRYFLGLGEAEISDELGCPRGTVKRRLHDARARLRAILADRFAAEGDVDREPSAGHPPTIRPAHIHQEGNPQ